MMYLILAENPEGDCVFLARTDKAEGAAHYAEYYLDLYEDDPRVECVKVFGFEERDAGDVQELETEEIRTLRRGSL